MPESDKPLQPNRREFLTRTVAGAAALSMGAVARGAAVGPVDQRVYGRLGKRVPILALGLGSAYVRGFGKQPEAGWAALRRAVELGVTYFDTANAYGPSQELIAPVVKELRPRLFVASKSGQRTADGFRRELEHSLKVLGCDRLDLFHVHNLSPKDDLAAIEKGAVAAARKAKEEGLIGAWGVTGHTNAAVFKQAVERWSPDALMTIFTAERRDDGRFEDELLPLARERQMAVAAIKVCAFGAKTRLPKSELLRYTLSLDGLGVAVVGFEKLPWLEENVAVCTGFKPLDKTRQAAVSRQVQLARGEALPLWEQAGYWDGKMV